MEQVDFPENVIDKYGDSCEMGDGRSCFGPSLAIQKFVTDCRSGNLVMVDGDVFKVKEGRIPVVITMEEKLHDKLAGIAISKNLSPQEFLELYAAMLMEDEEAVDGMDGIEKIAEDDKTFGEPDMWGESAEPPPTDDGYETPGPGSEAPKRRIARPGSNTIWNLGEVLNKIHEKASSALKIWLGFHGDGEVQMNIEYPEEGINVKTKSEGTLIECLDAHVARLDKWESVTFGPKLEEGTEIKASIGAKILGFDKSIGKYKVQLGENLVVDIDPDDISSIIDQ